MKTSLFPDVKLWVLMLLGVLCAPFLAAQDTHYYLIAGSFDNAESAGEMAAMYRLKSYDPVVIPPGARGGNYRVAIYQSTSRPEVDAFARQIKQENTSYWVYASKLQISSGSSRREGKPVESLDLTKSTYHLILESYETFEAAQIGKEEMEAQDYEAYLIYPDVNSSWYRVSVFTTQDREEIEAYQSFLRKGGRNSGWIYEALPGEASSLASGASIETSPGNDVVSGRRMTQDNSNPGRVTYHLIAGSFENFDQASRLSDALRSKGYNPLLMFPEPGVSEYFRVSVYQSTQRTRVDEFRKKFNQSNAWVFTQR